MPTAAAPSRKRRNACSIGLPKCAKRPRAEEPLERPLAQPLERPLAREPLERPLAQAGATMSSPGDADAIVVQCHRGFAALPPVPLPHEMVLYLGGSVQQLLAVLAPVNDWRRWLEHK